MTVQAKKSRARVVALSRAQIVQTAVEMLDESGVEVFTLRALANRLSTGAGAIYHYVVNKRELLTAATDEVILAVLADTSRDRPDSQVREVMLGMFDAISDHAWLGSQLAIAPWQPAVLRVLERIGSELEVLGVSEGAQFDSASVLVHHILGVANQYGAATGLSLTSGNRPAFMSSALADLVQEAGFTNYPFLKRIAENLVGHDDRSQFVTGVEIILAGIKTS